MKTISSVEAQNNFGSLMDQAMRAPITITKHGKPRVIMLAYEDLPEIGRINISELSPDTQKSV